MGHNLAGAMSASGTQRFAYIDWLRGFACVGMFEVHCYSSWLSGAARQGSFYGLSQFSGTLPAPLFVFLAGLSSALVMDRMRRKGVPADQTATPIIRRGGEILGLALLFRLQEYLLGLPKAPWTDLLRVDVLNMIGLSIVLIGVLCWFTQSRAASALAAAGVALGISLITPLVWTTWRPHWLPWFLESYVDGVHTHGTPQAWLFPLFPWSAFAFVGLAAGFILTSDWAVKNTVRTIGLFVGTGIGLFLLSWGFDSSPLKLYAADDYWHTSPNFFLARVGTVLVLYGIGYAWCRWGLGQAGFSPLIDLGQASLLVYWVHNEFVYGRLSILTRGAQGIPMATFGLLIIVAAMVLLAMARTRSKGRGAEILAWLHGIRSGAVRGAPRPEAEG
jgi:uncharacterized membrane protein